MNVIIYSVNFGDYDHVKDSLYLQDLPACYLTDTPENISEHSNWEPVPVDLNGEDPKRMTGYYKTQSHLLPDHDISIYIDASIRLKQSLNPIIAKFIQSDAQIMIPFHPQRSCTYDEANACIKLKKDKPALITRQMEQYRNARFPQGWGMVATCMIIRKNTPSVQLFNKLWNKEIVKGSKRDQLSVMYTSWSTGIPIEPLNINIYNNPYFKVCKHKSYEPAFKTRPS